jgi:exodeoxyribonuclease V alpha subunit
MVLVKYIQDIINPSSDDKVEVLVGEKIFRVGDMIMHVNSNTPEVVNGDTGRIVDIENTKNSVRIICDILGKCIIYEKENLRNLCLAYAITVHKAQGSEYKSVICCITMDHSAMLYRNIPYVAFSRSKVEVDLICDRAIDKAIKKENLKRITLLANLLKKMKDDEEKI